MVSHSGKWESKGGGLIWKVTVPQVHPLPDADVSRRL